MNKSIFKRHVFISAWIIMGFALATQYNACGNVQFTQSAESQANGIKAGAIILINKDAPYANSDLVEVNLDAPLADEVYVTNDPTCASGGVWEPLVATRAWTLAQKNQKAVVYAMFRNASENISTPCLSDDILHDDIPPAVVLQKPVVVTREESPILNFVADDLGSGLDKMFCEWPGQSASECQFATSNGKLAEGRYLVKIKASDKAGNVSQPVIDDLMVDRTPPVITILSGPPAIGNNRMAGHSFNVTDALSGVVRIECAVDDKTKYGACASPVSAMLADGAHKFFIRAYDLAGNMSELENAFSIDSLAPTVTITKFPPDFSKSKSGTFEFVGKDGIEDINQFECSLDGAAFVACSSPITYNNLAEGVHKFEVVGLDKVGNRSAPAARSWYVDTMAPTITFQLTPPALSNNVNPAFKYLIADSGSGVESQQCSLDGGAYAACAADGTSYANLADGDHTFRVRATDKAGNVGESALISFVIDQKPPTVQFTSVPSPFSNLVEFDFKFVAADDRGVDRVECKADAGAYVKCDSLGSHLVRGLTEGGHRFTVRAFDKAGNMSAEVFYDWTVDLTAPVISYFQLPPAAALSTTVISLGFTAVDALSGLMDVQCKLDNVVVACKSGEIKTLLDLMAGAHTFQVVATDKAGNVATDTKSISISDPVFKTQLVEVKANAKIDILLVVDNSGSMQGEQANMAARFNNFLDKIKGLDWQIGFVTTDMNNDAPLKDGRLVEIDGLAGQYILTSAMSQTMAQTLFGNTVQMPTNGSGTELGFRATMRAIDRAFEANVAASVPNTQLFRADAALAVLVVSDAYDSSGARPEDVLAKVQQRWGGNKPFVFHSIVVPESNFTDPTASTVNPNDPCKGYRESVKFDGRNYYRLSELTGGVKGTVCSEDYSVQLADMGKVTADLVNAVTLNCQPIDFNKDGKVDAGDVQVTSAAGAAITGFVLEGTKLTFTNALPIGVNEVKYYCAQ